MDLEKEKRGVFYNLGEALEAGSAIELKGIMKFQWNRVLGLKKFWRS